MNKNQIQYTVRDIPHRLDQILRERARRERRSLNDVALEALAKGLGLSEEPIRHHDLDDLAGTWADDPGFDKAIEEMRRMDSKRW